MIKEEYLKQILAGRKTIEVRVGYNNILRLKPGDCLLLNDQYSFILKRNAVYQSFDELLAQEDPHAIAPGLPLDQLLPAMRSIYPPEKEVLGVVALEIVPDRG